MIHKSRLCRFFERIFLAAALIGALELAAVLFTGGFSVSCQGTSYVFDDVALSTICVLILVLAHLFLKHELRFKAALQQKEPILLFSFSLICYLANHETLAVGDTLSNRYLPFSVIREGNFDLDEFQFLYAHGIPYWIRKIGGHYVSYYPAGATVLSLPFFFLSAVGSVDPRGVFPEQLEKFSASCLTALSVVLLLYTLRRVVDRKTALLLAGVYALGTSSLSVSSQALWQHGPSQLCLTAALYCLIRGRSDPRWIPPVAGALALSIVCRPTNFLIALPLCVYVAIHHFRKLHWFALSGLPVALFQVWYNVTYLGTPALSQADLAASHNWRGPLAANFAGLLFSPARGLFVYSPVFALLFPAVFQIWKNKEHLMLRYLSIGTLASLLLYSKWSLWTGGQCFGPRFLSDLCPVLVLMLTPLEPILKTSKFTRFLMLVLFAVSVAAHSLGAYMDDHYWNVYLAANKRLAWSWTDNQLINPLRRLWIRGVVRATDLPEASDSPQLLSASYNSTLQPGFECRRASVIYFDVDIVNTGRVACLTWPVAEKGWTRLGWLWRKGGKDLVRTRGFLRLRNDLLPGSKQTYTLAVLTPEKPGRYALMVELCSQNIGCFSDLGIAPLLVDAIVN